MEMIRTILLVIAFWYISHGYADTLDSFIAQYKRPITVLEITDLQMYHSLSYAPNYCGVFVLLAQSEKIDAIKKRVKDFHNVIVLHPEEFTTSSLSSLVNLAACEHFDITIVHDWSAVQKNSHIISALLNLGDYLIIDLPARVLQDTLPDEQKARIIWSHELPQGKQRVCFKHMKRTLDKARWHMSAPAQAKQPSYHIVSSFAEKKMVKGQQRIASDWVPGINLVTAMVLGMKFPTYDIVRDNIKQFLSIDHNDAVIGNMIVQGRKVKLIDFADARRNADHEKCLNAALKIFKWSHMPKDPYVALEKYAEYVHR